MTWDQSEPWYSDCVGEKGHYYHQSLVFPALKKWLQNATSLLDVGCGQGVLARQLSPKTQYVGVDITEALIREAKKLTPHGTFLVANAEEALPIEKKDFDAVTFVLCLQNMEHPDQALFQAASHLKKGGKLILILNHPAFRIPRQSGWGIDEASQIQYRRMNVYMSPQKIPIQTHPGRGKDSPTTYSYHHPISSYVQWLEKANCSICHMEEWCSDKKSEGSKAKREDRARKEFPLFLGLVAKKGS
jgi:ubiquinone/menaquinone biosynthesis C-methylase UbiE